MGWCHCCGPPSHPCCTAAATVSGHGDTFSTGEVARRTGLDVSRLGDRWAPRFGLSRVGCGYRHRWSLGQLLMVGALTGWLASAPHPENADVFDRFAAHGPRIIDGIDYLPRYLILHRGVVSDLSTPEEVAALYGLDFHVIDLHACASACGVACDLPKERSQ